MATDLSIERIVDVQITRETTTVTQAAFGTPGILAEFLTSKTTVAFDRFREYAAIAELTTDGWLATDPVYLAAQIIFSQGPKVEKIMVGRRDAADSDWATALAAVEAVTPDWYCFAILPNQVATVTFDIDFVTLNEAVFTINGTTGTAIPFNTSNEITYDDIKTQIELDVVGSTATIDAVARTVIITFPDQLGIVTASAVVTLGATQPVGVTTYSDVNDEFKEAAAWAETQKKIYFYSSGDADILTSATTDIVSFFSDLDYDRTVSSFRTNSPDYFEYGWMGETLPYDPGSQTWAGKTISGIAADSLTSGQANQIDTKIGNYYVSIGSISQTQTGKVASAEWIDVIRGVDWIEARMQEAVFTQLVNLRKIPFTDPGISIIETAMKGVLEEAVENDILISFTISVPKAADVSTVDKGNRELNDITFIGILAGAIQKVTINGTVSL